MNKIISPEYIKKLSSFDSPTISNAIEEFGVRDNTVGYASMELKCLTPGQKSMIGYAVTVTVDTTTPGQRPARFGKLPELFDLVNKSPKPSVIVFKYVGPDRFRSCGFGDLAAKAFQKIGASGIVTDLGVRDLSGIRERVPGFHVFSPGLVVSHGVGNFMELGTTVSVCGLTIKQGDLLHGDGSGVVSIPIDLIDIKALIARAKAIIKQEKQIFDYLESSSWTLEGIKERLVPRK